MLADNEGALFPKTELRNRTKFDISATVDESGCKSKGFNFFLNRGEKVSTWLAWFRLDGRGLLGWEAFRCFRRTFDLWIFKDKNPGWIRTRSRFHCTGALHSKTTQPIYKTQTAQKSLTFLNGTALRSPSNATALRERNASIIQRKVRIRHQRSCHNRYV